MTFREARSVVRKLARSPLFTLVSILTLALGIGANAAIFSVVNGVLLKPLPFDEPESLVGVWHKAPGLGFADRVHQSPATYYTYREEATLFEDIGMWNDDFVSVTGIDEPEQVVAIYVTDATLPLVRVGATLGRIFSREDDMPEAPRTVVLSHGYWQRRFGGDPGVLGRPLIIDGDPHEIIGVLPEGLRFLGLDPALWLPFRFDRANVFVGDFSYQALARLRPGVTLEAANAELSRLLPMAVEKFPRGMTLEMMQEAEFGPNVRPLKRDVVGDVGSVLWVLFATVGLVLLIACANVANLFLVRASGRQREIALRTALGAGRGRIAGELLIESVTLGVVGGGAGLALAFGAVRVLVALAPDHLPRLEAITIDPTVVVFTLAISVLAGFAFGLIPILHCKRPNLSASLQEGGRSGEGRERHRARSALVVSQIALALVLLVGSGLMIRSFQALRQVAPGFVQPDDVVTLKISIPEAEVEDPAQAVRIHEQILRRVEQIPGVRSVGLSSSITMDGRESADGVHVEEFPTPEGQLATIRRFKWISENYFRTMGNPILAGRDLTWADVHSMTPVAIVTENFATEYWDSPLDAIGKRIRETTQGPWREIVGVVGNIHDNGVAEAATPTVFWPMLQDSFWNNGVFTRRTMGYAIRTSRLDEPGFLGEIRTAVWSVNSNLPIASVYTLRELLDQSMARTAFTLVLLTIAAVVALLLGVIGIYGVVSYAVSHRTREIGVRMALGARRGDVSRLVLREGMVLTLAGVCVGLVAAIGSTRLMSSLLFGVNPVDPLTYAVVSIALAGVALTASYIPARRAASIPPTQALRAE